MKKMDQISIFTMFHDGDITSFTKNGSDINFTIEIDYLAEMIDPTYTFFKGVLKNCHYCTFKPWGSDKICVEDVKIIETLIRDLEISKALFSEGQTFIHFLGVGKNIGGTLTLSCESIVIYDEREKEITFNELRDISRQYWQRGTNPPPFTNA